MPTCAWIPALRLLSGPAATRLARTNGFREAWNKVEQIRLDERERIEAEAAAERRLIENAGVAGVDESGQQLDQREFAATRESLRRLASARASLYCHRFIHLSLASGRNSCASLPVEPTREVTRSSHSVTSSSRLGPGCRAGA